MNSLPILTINIGLSQEADSFELKVELQGKESGSGYLRLPFPTNLIPSLLRALNARQYNDYPHRERFIRTDSDRTQIIPQLQSLNLWNIENSFVVSDVHVRVGKLLGSALMSQSAVEEGLTLLYDTAIQSGGGELVFCFESVAMKLAALPWELAHHGSQPLLLTKGVVLGCTRVICFDHKLSSPRPTPARLRVLTIAPRIQMDETGRAFEELARNRMREALRELPVDIESLPQATMTRLQSRLQQEPPIDILDYYGHGVFSDDGGALLMENNEGGRDAVSASRFATLSKLPPLIVLNACQSAQIDIDAPLASIAVALSNANVRTVLAMQLTTRMASATNAIIPEFYKGIAAGESVQRSVALVRQALYTAEPDGASWYVPALYLRQADNQPYILRKLKLAKSCPPNPFAGEGARENLLQLVGRTDERRWIWERLRAGGNISIIGPSGSGKSTMTAAILAETQQQLGHDVNTIEMVLHPKTKLIEAQLLLAHRLGGRKASDLILLLDDKDLHIILILDDLGSLDKGERGRDVRLWLRGLSQSRHGAKVQLVATSARPLDQIFHQDDTRDASPLHNVMSDMIQLGPLNTNDMKAFISSHLSGTFFEAEDFSKILVEPLLPRKLQEACRRKYDDLCKSFNED